MTDTENNQETLAESASGNDNEPGSPEVPSFWNRHKSEIGLAAVILYVFLLTLGTIGELFDIEWILDLPLFRPPGKY